MKILFTTLLILLITSSAFTETYTVERVINANTLKLTSGDEVQLIGIAAPEDEKRRQAATKYWEWLEGREVRLEFDVQQRDKHGKLWAYVWYQGGRTLEWNEEPTEDCQKRTFELKEIGIFIEKEITEYETRYDYEIEDGCRYSYVDMMINAIIMYKGHATPMTIPPNVKYADLFKRLYEEAMEEETARNKNSFENFLNASSSKAEEPKGLLKYIDHNGVKLDTSF